MHACTQSPEGQDGADEGGVRDTGRGAVSQQRLRSAETMYCQGIFPVYQMLWIRSSHAQV